MRRACIAAGSCVLALAMWCSTAQAWTEARVESAGAHLDVDGSGRARVSLRIGIRVLGGWLSKLELAGLDPGLALDPDKPPSLISEDGQKLAPELRFLRDGRVEIGFAGRSRSPHRGRHELRITYTTTLASETDRDGARTLRWSLPAFSADLRDVELWVSAPSGTRASEPADGAVTLTQLARGERTILRWQRAQLPRTLAFEAALHVPPAAVRGAARAPRQERVPLLASPATWAALCLLLLVAAKRAAVAASSRTAHARVWPLLGLRGRARAAASVAFATLAAWLHPVQPALGSAALIALGACALDRGCSPLPRPALRWTRARYALELSRLRRLRAAHLLGGAAWLDATTPLGFGLLAACYAVLLQRAALGAGLDVWMETLLAATPLWFSATRYAWPRGQLELLLTEHQRRAVPASTPRASTRASASDPRGGAIALASAGDACPPPVKPAVEGRRGRDRAA